MEQVLEMNYSFHPEAEKEFVEAIDYFEEVEIGLGYGIFIVAVMHFHRNPEYWKNRL
ncbi:MAG: hypothetical protein Q8O92_07700 [Candidatus Latescibacter sp.]|nr:hypothetical protein [Candidatus Latescibacter sp.]